MPDATERLLAMLPPAGTPTGHVPTVQADGSILWQAPSGGGSQDGLIRLAGEAGGYPGPPWASGPATP